MIVFHEEPENLFPREVLQHPYLPSTVQEPCDNTKEGRVWIRINVGVIAGLL